MRADMSSEAPDQAMDFDFLTPEERDAILTVLARDENLRRKEEERIEQLKREIRELRAEEFSRISFDASKFCGRCLQEFGWLFNRGQVCSKCRLRVCKKCRQLLNNRTWLCIICLRILELESQTGNWFYSDYPTNRKSKSSYQIISAIDLLRSSLSESQPLHPEKDNGLNVAEEKGGEQPEIILKLTGRDYEAMESDNAAADTIHRALMMDLIVGRETRPQDSDDDDNEDEREKGDPPFKKKKLTNLAASLSSSMESLKTIYSGAGEIHYGKVLVGGDVEMNCRYDNKQELLDIHVVQCRNLGVVNFSKKSSNPYMKCYLLPNKSRRKKRKSHVVKNSLNPVFNVTFQYKIGHASLAMHSLCLMVWHADKLGRNDFLGETIIPLDSMHLKQLETTQWLPLKARSSLRPSALSYYGDFDLCLKFVSKDSLKMKEVSSSSRGELQVLVKQARNLSTHKSSSLNGSYCRALLLQDNLKIVRQKSAAVESKSNNPCWNHTFVFTDVTRNHLLESSLELTFWDKDRGSSDFLGGIRLNGGGGSGLGKIAEFMDAKGEEVFLWQSMLDRPDTWIEGTLMLRANMTSRK